MHTATFSTSLKRIVMAFACLTLLCTIATADGNRLAYLDESDPYYVHRSFPKLTTPMWVGEPGVEAVVVLAIDDMSDPVKYEAYLRPILERLKQIDGRAPVTIFSNKPDPAHPMLQQLLQEGCSFDVHTISHPCPLLNEKGFTVAGEDVHNCTTLLNQIPGNKAVAFRMPCCDSQNTPSPRFYDGIFDKVAPDGSFLTIDSSVFNITTPNDPELPRELVLDSDGGEKFRKYLPFPSFVNTIEDYPYPYVINKVCWEFPNAVPSDWEAQNLNGKNNPKSIDDMKASLDAAVIKKGVYTLVFHPHGWMENTQVVELINHAVTKYGSKVKFLNFAEVQQRLDANLLDGNPLRNAQGADNGVRILDLNDDGYQDVLIGNAAAQRTRVWNNHSQTWIEQELPFKIVDDESQDSGARFVPNLDLRGDVVAVKAAFDESSFAYAYTREGWSAIPDLAEAMAQGDFHDGARFRDLDGDGKPEFLGAGSGVYRWDGELKGLEFFYPSDIADISGGEWPPSARLVDLDEDKDLDIVLADGKVSGVYLFESIEKGWGENILPEGTTLPPIAVDGKNNGAWFHSRHLWVVNETTAKLPDLADRRSFNELLSGVAPTSRSPEASLASIRVKPGFKVELVAAEPLIADPVAFEWAADGSLFVVEMRDYPLGMDGKGEPGSRIKLLRDDDGDGKYDRSTIFHDGLAFAMGLFPWRKGLLVTCAPDILYLEDTNGDDVADIREVLYTGFGEGNQQHRVNGLRWGLDNWIYGANGDSSGEITSTKSAESLNLRGRDFRIRPDGGHIDGQAGQTQFSRARDDWGNWFGCNNSYPIYHYTLADEYAKRNNHYAFPRATNLLIEDRANYAISRYITRFNEEFNANTFTSVCGLDIYRDTLLGEDFYNNAFVGEPVHNLVFRMELAPEGASFTAKRPLGEEKKEFLASTDNWFRPVMTRTGPDGALYIADMYRAHIEHPEYISEVDIARTNFLLGNDMGRIYRVYPVGKEPRTIQPLNTKKTADLVAKLDHPNPWVRDTAHRLLIESNDKTAVEPLAALASTSKNPVARVHALNVLDGLAALDEKVLLSALASEQPGVVRHAIRLSEPFLGMSPEIGAAVLAHQSNTDKQVQLQLAYSLGNWDSPEAAQTLGALLAANTADRQLAHACISSLNATNTPLLLDSLLAYLQSAELDEEHRNDVLAMSVRLSEAGNNSDMLAKLVEVMALSAEGTYTEGHFSAATTLLNAARGEAALETLAGADGLLAPVFTAARAVAPDHAQVESLRVSALSLLVRQPAEIAADQALAQALIDPREDLAVSRAAIDCLARSGGDGAIGALLAGWSAYTHEIRGQVLDVLLAQPEGVEAILAQMEAQVISPRQLDAGHRQVLLTSQDSAVRARVDVLMAGLVNADRAAVIEQFMPAANLTGDRAHGQLVYEELCSKCHQMGDLGFVVGPDLAAAGSGSFETLITAILDPNRVVEGRYTSYTIETKNFETFTGVLAGENANSITLANAGGVQQSVLRDDIETMTAGDQSIMPSGLEEGLQPQDFADLIAYVRGEDRKPKSFPGNAPAIVEAGAEGTLELQASNAEIYGDTLQYEETYRNLGFWGSINDHAVWKAKVPAAGNYQVTLEYCCDNTTAGNLYRLESGANILGGEVSGTGTWDRYQESEIGTLALEAGEQRIVFRAGGPINQYLIDLRAIKLTPVK